MKGMFHLNVPEFRCKAGCHDCCGVHFWLRSDTERIRAYLQRQGRAILKPGALGETCPYLTPQGCSIYPVRPVVCRVYGTIPELRCKHSCGKPMPAKAYRRFMQWFEHEKREGGFTLMGFEYEPRLRNKCK